MQFLQPFLEWWIDLCVVTGEEVGKALVREVFHWVNRTANGVCEAVVWFLRLDTTRYICATPGLRPQSTEHDQLQCRSETCVMSLSARQPARIALSYLSADLNPAGRLVVPPVCVSFCSGPPLAAASSMTHGNTALWDVSTPSPQLPHCPSLQDGRGPCHGMADILESAAPQPLRRHAGPRQARGGCRVASVTGEPRAAGRLQR